MKFLRKPKKAPGPSYTRPESLPSKDRRRLTLPLEQPVDIRTATTTSQKRLFRKPLEETTHTTVQQKSLDQSQCTLFQRLPVELRQQVYRHTLGYQDFHIVDLDGRLGAVVCTVLDEDDKDDWQWPNHHCWGRRVQRITSSVITYGGPSQKGYRDVGVPGLALLKTCRVIYSEAVEFLYSANTFIFEHANHPVDLRNTILPQRFEQIRSICIARSTPAPFKLPAGAVCCFGSGFDSAWWDLWQCLKELPSLRRVRLRLYTPDSTWTKEDIREPLFSVNYVRQCEDVVVRVPWRMEEMPDDLPRLYPELEPPKFIVETEDGGVMTVDGKTFADGTFVPVRAEAKTA